jgi:hypothetical protein
MTEAERILMSEGAGRVCPVEITPEDYKALSGSAAVVIREYEGPSGKRIGKLIAHGSLEEMQDLAGRPEIVIVPTGYHVITQQCILVADLIGPEVGEGHGWGDGEGAGDD